MCQLTNQHLQALRWNLFELWFDQVWSTWSVSIGAKTRLLHHFQWSVSLTKRNGMSSKMQVASSVGFPYRDKRIWGAHMDFEFTGHPLCVCETIIEFDSYLYMWINWSCVLFFLVMMRFLEQWVVQACSSSFWITGDHRSAKDCVELGLHELCLVIILDSSFLSSLDISQSDS